MSRRIPASERTREVLSDLIEGRLSCEDGRLPARDALIQILLLPVALAIAIAGIGLVWVVLHYVPSLTR